MVLSFVNDFRKHWISVHLTLGSSLLGLQDYSRWLCSIGLSLNRSVNKRSCRLKALWLLRSVFIGHPVFKAVFALNRNQCSDHPASMKSGQKLICKVSARNRPVITLSCYLSLDPWCPLAAKWLVITSVACTKVQVIRCGHRELRKRINTLQILQVQPVTKDLAYPSVPWILHPSVLPHSCSASSSLHINK